MKICSAVKARHGLQLSASNLPTVIQGCDRRFRRLFSQENSRTTNPSSCPAHNEYEKFFIPALVWAGSCKQSKENERQWHFKQIPQRSKFTLGLQPSESIHRRSMHTGNVSPRRQAAVSPEIPREEYANLLDYYGDHATEDYTNKASNESSAALVIEEEHKTECSIDEETHHFENFARVNVTIKAAIVAIEDPAASLDHVFQLYSAIPRPGVRSLPLKDRDMLLYRLSTPQKKTPRSTLRFLSVMDDMKNANLTISRAFWNSAVHLVGRTLGIVTSSEVEKALQKWKEMEQDAGVSGSSVTFNILLDVAVKAGQFSLAEMILDEIKARALRLDRFTRIGLIYYHGMKGNGDGIRKNYRELVEAGEIIDTTVLNCVIASLFQAGESTAAEHVYARMKVLHTKAGGREIGYLPKKTLKQIAQALQKAAIKYKNHPTLLRNLQDEQILAPDTQTFIILVKHHVSKTGQMSAVTKYLDEMQAFGVPVHGRIFHELFRGFALHGGVRYTLWSESQLRNVWAAFLNISEQGLENVYWGRWMVIWILRAFSRCCGENTALGIWSIIKPRWTEAKNDEEFMLSIIDRALLRHHVHTRNS